MGWFKWGGNPQTTQQTTQQVQTGTNMSLGGYTQVSLLHYGFVPAYIVFAVCCLVVAGGIGLAVFTSEQFVAGCIHAMNPDDTGFFGNTICPATGWITALFIFVVIQWNFFRSSGHYATQERQHTSAKMHGEGHLDYEHVGIGAYFSKLFSGVGKYFIFADLATDVGGYLRWGWAGIMNTTGFHADRFFIGLAVSIGISLIAFFAGEGGFIFMWHFLHYGNRDRRRNQRIDEEHKRNLDEFMNTQNGMLPLNKMPKP